MFTLQEVSKRYGSGVALHPLDLGIAPRRTTVLIGPSGCGKSTLLRMMAGLVTPDQGTVFFDRQPVTPERLPALRQSIGYVIQDGGLFPHLTARANVTIMARHLRRSNADIDARVQTLRELTRLPADALDRFPAELSGGQRQRVSLMRALMLDPDVLLLDEPLGALDPMIRYDLQQDLLEIFHRLEKTVILVTHDLREAAFFASTVVLMKDGAIVQEGAIEDLFTRPATDFVRKFLNAQRNPLPRVAEVP